MSNPKFGRIPPETVALMEKNVALVRDTVLAALPAKAGKDLKAFTVEQILDVVLRDWSENENTTGLLDADVADLCSFVQLAASLAGSDLNGAGYPIYQATLKGLLEDWLAHWNAEGDPGPPGPID